jgi:hypothetical protein
MKQVWHNTDAIGETSSATGGEVAFRNDEV